MINGVFNIDKPAGITSHDVVDQIRKITRERRVGHAGTLDPFATGVLVVGIGKATRLLAHARDLTKIYRTTFILGATSDTDDRTGTITPTPSPASAGTPPPAGGEIKQALQSFLGSIEQIPPAYSAVKVQGKKLYEIARYSNAEALAKAAERKRTVVIHDMKVLHYEYPTLELDITCGSGTYIRAIARDLGKNLGVGAYVQTLRRTAIGHFTITNAIALNALTAENLADYVQVPEILLPSRDTHPIRR